MYQDGSYSLLSNWTKYNGEKNLINPNYIGLSEGTIMELGAISMDVYGNGKVLANIANCNRIAHLYANVNYTIAHKTNGTITFVGENPSYPLYRLLTVNNDNTIVDNIILYKSTDQYTDNTYNYTPKKDCSLIAIGCWDIDVSITVEISKKNNLRGIIEETGTSVKQLSSLKENVDDLSDKVYKKDIIIDEKSAVYQDGYVKYSDGEISTNAFSHNTNFIAVKAGDIIDYNIYAIGSVVAVIASYNNEKLYQPKQSVKSVGISGTWDWSKGQYIVPDGISHVIITSHTTKESQTFSISRNSKTVYDFKAIEQNKQQINSLKLQLESSGIVNQWKGKKWVAFGTSITDTNNDKAPDKTATGKYVPYLNQFGEFGTLVNRGIAGGCINGHILYYVRYYKSDLSDADIVTIEGCVNDWYTANIPLGKVGDTIPYTNTLLEDSTPEGTFAGACYCAFSEAIKNAPNATIVLLTESQGQLVESTGGNASRKRILHNKVDNGDYHLQDFIDMTINVAKWVGIHVIDAGAESMINEDNPQYLIDHIHHTELGGKQYATVAWAMLKNIPSKVTLL